MKTFEQAGKSRSSVVKQNKIKEPRKSTKSISRKSSKSVTKINESHDHDHSFDHR